MYLELRQSPNIFHQANWPRRDANPRPADTLVLEASTLTNRPKYRLLSEYKNIIKEMHQDKD